MNYTVNGHTTYCYTGGKSFDAAKPTVVFIHGVLNDHSVWILQSRWFANHGWNVLAVDLPGHCRSVGKPPASVEEAAGFVVALLDAAGVDKAALVGHSFGSLIALETGLAPSRMVPLLAYDGMPLSAEPVVDAVEAERRARLAALGSRRAQPRAESRGPRADAVPT